MIYAGVLGREAISFFHGSTSKHGKINVKTGYFEVIEGRIRKMQGRKTKLWEC